MRALILIRSLTYAQRAVYVLGKAGIAASVAKAPLGTGENGCSYAVRLPRKALGKAVYILESSHISYGRLLERNEEGQYREALL